MPPDEHGRVDREALRQLLLRYKSRPRRFGSFSAASNVTGVKEDVDAVTALLHQHGALAFWDYAAAASHTGVDMNPKPAESRYDHSLLAKDAVFVSTHKMPGGPGCPGMLLVKKQLLNNPVPSTPGGGAVFYVTGSDHRYLANLEEREEAGTPNILGAIRSGLVIQLMEAVGVDGEPASAPPRHPLPPLPPPPRPSHAQVALWCCPRPCPPCYM